MDKETAIIILSLPLLLILILLLAIFCNSLVHLGYSLVVSKIEGVQGMQDYSEGIEKELVKIGLIANDVRNDNEYIKDEYMCGDFAKELKKRLNESNYNTTCAVGDLILNETEKSFHGWVIVYINENEYPIEATSGVMYLSNQDREYYNKTYEFSNIWSC